MVFCNQVISQAAYFYYDFNSFNGPGEWTRNGSNSGSLNGNMSFNMNGSLQNNSTKYFQSPHYNINGNTLDLQIEYEIDINLRLNDFVNFWFDCWCVRNDELRLIYFDNGVWYEAASHSGSVSGIQQVSIPHTAERLRFELETDPGTISGRSAEIMDLTLEQSVNLPIVLSSFEVKTAGNKVQLEWTTESEINNSHFLVERSGGSKFFHFMGKIKGNGSSSVSNQYEFIDEFPLNGYNYYRLTQVDFNGKSEQFDPRAVYVDIEEKESSIFKIFPNPSQDRIILLVQDGVEGELLIKNVEGEVIQKNTIAAGRNDIDISHLTSGYYFFYIFRDSRMYIEKFIKL